MFSLFLFIFFSIMSFANPEFSEAQIKQETNGIIEQLLSFAHKHKDGIVRFLLSECESEEYSNMIKVLGYVEVNHLVLPDGNLIREAQTLFYEGFNRIANGCTLIENFYNEFKNSLLSEGQLENYEKYIDSLHQDGLDKKDLCLLCETSNHDAQAESGKDEFLVRNLKEKTIPYKSINEDILLRRHLVTFNFSKKKLDESLDESKEKKDDLLSKNLVIDNAILIIKTLFVAEFCKNKIKFSGFHNYIIDTVCKKVGLFFQFHKDLLVSLFMKKDFLEDEIFLSVQLLINYVARYDSLKTIEDTLCKNPKGCKDYFENLTNYIKEHHNKDFKDKLFLFNQESLLGYIALNFLGADKFKEKLDLEEFCSAERLLTNKILKLLRSR